MPRKTRTVLIVDDNATARNVLTFLIRQDPKLRVKACAHDGLEAVDLTGDECPDVIILDHEMPRLTGLDALPQLREQCPEARIIMWSTAVHLRDSAVAAGGDAFVDKMEPLETLMRELRAS